MFLGTLEPRKNLVGLIEAYNLLKTESKEDIPQLVLAGGKGWYYESIFETVKKLHLEQDVIFTGYVPEEDSPLLMNGAVAFVFPSLYEGFGMPPLEAMACGTPVIVSDTASLPEVVRDAGVYVDPNSVESMKEGLLEIWGNIEIGKILKRQGIEHSKQFQWEIVTRILKDNLDRKDKNESSI